jgi:hypothetical protein
MKPIRCLGILVAVSYTLLLVTFHQWRRPSAAELWSRYDWAVDDSSGMVCIAEKASDIGTAWRWAHDADTLVANFGQGSGDDSSWQLITRGARQVAGNVTMAKKMMRELLHEAHNEQHDSVGALVAAHIQLADAHRFGGAYDGIRTTVNMPFVLIHRLCSALTDADDCRWAEPYPPRKGDMAVYYELVRELRGIRQRSLHHTRLHILSIVIARTEKQVKDVHNLAVSKLIDDTLSVRTCARILRWKCSRYELARETQPKVRMATDAYFAQQEQTQHVMGDVSQMLKNAQEEDRGLDQWLIREERGAAEGRHSRPHYGWEVMLTGARDELHRSLKFACPRKPIDF